MADQKSEKPSIDSLNFRIDSLIKEVNALRIEMKEWKDDLIEEFSELTGLLMDHYEQVIDRHLIGHSVIEAPKSPESSSELSATSGDSSEESSDESDERSGQKSDQTLPKTPVKDCFDSEVD